MFALGQGIAKGMVMTFKHMLRKSFAFQYPKEKREPALRYRGALRLQGAINEDFPEIGPSKDMPPCTATCPANVDARGYINLIAQGKYHQAYALHMESNPLPAVCGRVCAAPCQEKCRRGEEDEAIAIRALKRFMSDFEFRSMKKGEVELPSKPSKSNFLKDKPVAIVGAGPAGLAASYYLARAGYPVTVFEKLPVPGGMLTVGIPEYRLPRDILLAEINLILDTGVDLRLNTAVESLDSLFEQGYKAVFLGIGAHKPLRLDIPGEGLEGVMAGETLLRKISLGEKVKLGKKVVIIGGGNTAIDCARTMIRKGAEKVTIAYRRSKKEMPAHEEEIADADAEKIHFEYLAAPTKILGKDGRAEKMECLRMELGPPDKSGRRRPVPIKDSEFIIDTDMVLLAISRMPEIDWLADSGIEISRWDTIVADPVTGATSREGVFAGGDAVLGPDIAVAAIGGGRRSAQAIHEYLSGAESGEVAHLKNLAQEVTFKSRYSENPIREEIPKLLPRERIEDFREVELAFTKNSATKEAERCLSCKTRKCIGCGICVQVCPNAVINIEVSQNGIRKIEGYNVAFNKCMFCGICAEYCPTETLIHTNEYELAADSQLRLVYDKEQMLRRNR